VFKILKFITVKLLLKRGWRGENEYGLAQNPVVLFLFFAVLTSLGREP
jgi:hypothetical protein